MYPFEYMCTLRQAVAQSVTRCRESKAPTNVAVHCTQQQVPSKGR